MVGGILGHHRVPYAPSHNLRPSVPIKWGSFVRNGRGSQKLTCLAMGVKDCEPLILAVAFARLSSLAPMMMRSQRCRINSYVHIKSQYRLAESCGCSPYEVALNGVCDDCGGEEGGSGAGGKSDEL
eukprot:2341934-Amphidinium_carterae.2